MMVPTLKGSHVILRPLRVSDAHVFCRWFHNAEVTRFLQRQYGNPPTLREEQAYLRTQQRRSDHAQWGIVVPRGGLIGTVGLDKIDREHRHAVYGIFIGEPRYWGQGLGTEAGRLAVAYGLGKLRLHRIMLHVFAYNTRGMRSYRQLGFRQEGRLRDHLYRDGHFHDIIVMGMLRAEFLESAKRKTQRAKEQRKI